MSRLVSADLRKIFDSRGSETVEAEVTTETGVRASAGAPSGASTGKREVRALPVGGVEAALRIFRDRCAPRLIGHEASDQAEIDALLHEIDGTEDFGTLGGNPATALSVATAIASAKEQGKPLWQKLARPGVDVPPFPAIVGNCMNGGRHAIGGPDFQEYLAIAFSARPGDAIRASLAVHKRVGEELHRRLPKQAIGRGDEGGWVAPVGNVDALEVLANACTRVRDETGLEVYPGLDLAASEFYHDGKYRTREQTVDSQGQVGFVTKLVEKYDIRYVEDPFDQESFDEFAEFTQAMGARTLVVGDDLYTTSKTRLERGTSQSATNAILIKVNQVGTLSDALATVDYARSHHTAIVTSHRSGEVVDHWLAHLAVAFGSVGLKCGLLGGERVAKLNELLRLAAAAEKGSG